MVGETGADKDSNVGATLEKGEQIHGLMPGGASVWYVWRAPVSGRATFETRASNFDTVIAVYQGESLRDLRKIGDDDDSGGDQIGTSRVAFNVAAGETYRVVVDGFKGATGAVALAWSIERGQPANDDFEKAHKLTGASGVIDGSTKGATRQPGEPMHLFPGTSSVWYKWVAPATARFFMKSEGADFDLLLAVYKNKKAKPLEQIETAHNGEYGNDAALEFDAEANCVYYIAVDAGQNTAGTFKLHYGPVQQPSRRKPGD